MSGNGGGLRRELGLLDATMINVGTIVASAIFIVPSAILAGLGSSVPAVLVWVIGGVVSLFGALCVAELGAALPDAGGQYVYHRRAFGPAMGFLYGWAAFLLINCGSIAAIAVGFATYLGVFVPLSPTGIKWAAVASIVALTVVNLRGLRVGATTQNVLTGLKIAVLVAILLLAAGLHGGSAANLQPLWPAGGWRTLLAGLGPALVAVLYTYDGWIECTYVAGEIRDPGRIVPLSIVLSTVLVTVLYVLVSIAFLWLLPPEQMKTSPLVASDAMQVVLGSAGSAFVAAAILVSTLGANNGIIFTAVRIPYAMAEDGLFFDWARRLNPRTHSPDITLGVQAAIAVVMTLTGSFVQLTTYVVFAGFLFYGLSAAAVIVLRRREPGLARPYRAWGYPVTPLLFIGFAGYLVLDTFVHAPRESFMGTAIILAGLPLYWFWRRRLPVTA